MIRYGQLLRFHSVAEFSSYCTSVLSLSYNASNTKYSTRGVSSHQYRYNKWNNKYNAGLPLTGECPSGFDLTAQPVTYVRKKKRNGSKLKSIFLNIHKGSTCGRQRRETLLKFERGTISTSRFPNPSQKTAPRLCPRQVGGGGGSGADFSQVVGWEQ